MFVTVMSPRVSSVSWMQPNVTPHHAFCWHAGALTLCSCDRLGWFKNKNPLWTSDFIFSSLSSLFSSPYSLISTSLQSAPSDHVFSGLLSETLCTVSVDYAISHEREWCRTVTLSRLWFGCRHEAADRVPKTIAAVQYDITTSSVLLLLHNSSTTV